MNRKILIIGPSLNAKGGVALYFKTILPLLEKDKTIEVRYTQIGSSSGQGFLGCLYTVTKEMLTFRPTLTHVNTSLGWKSFIRDGAYLIIAKLFNSKTVVFFRGWSLSEKDTSSFMFKVYFKLCYSNTNGFCVLNNTVEKYLKEWNPNSRIFRHTTTVDSKLLETTSLTRKKTFSSELNVLFLSRIEKEKGIFELLNAIKILIEEGVNVSLTVAGKGTAELEAKSFVKTNNIDNYVKFAGFVEATEKVNLLIEASVFCLPSYTEGMPNSVLEAMCFGLPIIATPVGALPELIDDNSGVIVNLRSSESIAAAIKKFLDLELIERISSHNKKYAIENFLSQSVCQKLITTYRDLHEFD